MEQFPICKDGKVTDLHLISRSLSRDSVAFLERRPPLRAVCHRRGEGWWRRMRAAVMSAVITLTMIELTLPQSINSKCGRTQSVNTRPLAAFWTTVTHSVCTGRPCSCLWPAPPRRRGVRRVWVRAPCTLCCAASRSRTCTLTTRSTRSSFRPLMETGTKTRTSTDRFSVKGAHRGRSEASFYRSLVHCRLISNAAPAETHTCRRINHLDTPGCSWRSPDNLMYRFSFLERQTLIKKLNLQTAACVCAGERGCNFMIKQAQSKSCNTICIKTFPPLCRAPRPPRLHQASIPPPNAPNTPEAPFFPLIWTQTHPVYAETQTAWQKLEAGQNEINLEVCNHDLLCSPSRPHGHF